DREIVVPVEADFRGPTSYRIQIYYRPFDDCQSSVIDKSLESVSTKARQGRVRFKCDDSEPFSQVKFCVLSLVHPNVVDEVLVLRRIVELAHERSFASSERSHVRLRHAPRFAMPPSPRRQRCAAVLIV